MSDGLYPNSVLLLLLLVVGMAILALNWSRTSTAVEKQKKE